jgi:hypothetical protein
MQLRSGTNLNDLKIPAGLWNHLTRRWISDTPRNVTRVLGQTQRELAGFGFNRRLLGGEFDSAEKFGVFETTFTPDERQNTLVGPIWHDVYDQWAGNHYDDLRADGTPNPEWRGYDPAATEFIDTPRGPKPNPLFAPEVPFAPDRANASRLVASFIRPMVDALDRYRVANGGACRVYPTAQFKWVIKPRVDETGERIGKALPPAMSNGELLYRYEDVEVMSQRGKSYPPLYSRADIEQGLLYGFDAPPDEPERKDSGISFDQLTQDVIDLAYSYGRDSCILLHSFTATATAYSQIAGSSHHPFPSYYPEAKMRRAGVVNIDNKDDQCFLYAALCAIERPESKPQRVSKYEHRLNEINMEGIDFPVTLRDIPKIELLNQQTIRAINVFFTPETSDFSNTHALHNFRILHRSQNNRLPPDARATINLVWFPTGSSVCENNRVDTPGHYCAVRNVDALLSSSEVRRYYCNGCLKGYARSDVRDAHQMICSEGCQILMPGEKKILLKDARESQRREQDIKSQREGLNRIELAEADEREEREDELKAIEAERDAELGEELGAAEEGATPDLHFIKFIPGQYAQVRHPIAIYGDSESIARALEHVHDPNSLSWTAKIAEQLPASWCIYIDTHDELTEVVDTCNDELARWMRRDGYEGFIHENSARHPETWWRAVKSVRQHPTKITSLEDLSQVHGVGTAILDVAQAYEFTNEPAEVFQFGPNERLLRFESTSDDQMDATAQMLQALQRLERVFRAILKARHPIDLTPEQETAYEGATCCHYCDEPFDGDHIKVCDHDHTKPTRNYRAAACRTCNMNIDKSWKKRMTVPFYCHNSKGYDSHHIIREVSDLEGDYEITATADNSEKFKALKLTSRSTQITFNFLDTMAHQMAGLQQLAGNLPDERKVRVRRFVEETYPAEPQAFQLLTAKIPFPYEYMDSMLKLDEPLPPLELQADGKTLWWNSLGLSDLTDADRELIRSVQRVTGITTFRQWHDLYLQMDVLLLADIHEDYRSWNLVNYGLDPTQFITGPALFSAAQQKMCKSELHQLSDSSMYTMLESGKRGGMSGAITRHFKANNPGAPQTYDPSGEQVHMLYEDMNNLYGYAMCQTLPYQNFEWVDCAEWGEHELRQLHVEPMTADFSNPEESARVTEGHIVEVDIEYPEHLHDQHSQLPMAPEKTDIQESWLSPYALGVRETKAPRTNVKLTSHFLKRDRYVIDIRTLRFYLDRGLVVTKVHRGIRFDQCAWLRPWIQFNTAQRVLAKAAGNEADGDRFKVANNAVYGKQLEDVRARRTMRFSLEPKQFEKRKSDPRMKAWHTIPPRSGSGRALWISEHEPESICLDRPIFAGVSILDLSKLAMFQYWYDELQPRVCADGDWSRLQLGMMDTDSYLYRVRHDNWPAIQRSMRHLHDTSNLPKKHPDFREECRAIPGLMKDELGGQTLIESIHLRSKCYSLRFGDDAKAQEKKLCKGVSKIRVKTQMNLEHYRRALEGKTHYQEQRMIRSSNQRIFTILQTKRALAAYDDKRYILDDGVHSLPYGHCDIPFHEEVSRLTRGADPR